MLAPLFPPSWANIINVALNPSQYLYNAKCSGTTLILIWFYKKKYDPSQDLFSATIIDLNLQACGTHFSIFDTQAWKAHNEIKKFHTPWYIEDVKFI